MGALSFVTKTIQFFPCGHTSPIGCFSKNSQRNNGEVEGITHCMKTFASRYFGSAHPQKAHSQKVSSNEVTTLCVEDQRKEIKFAWKVLKVGGGGRSVHRNLVTRFTIRYWLARRTSGSGSAWTPLSYSDTNSHCNCDHATSSTPSGRTLLCFCTVSAISSGHSASPGRGGPHTTPRIRRRCCTWLIF